LEQHYASHHMLLVAAIPGLVRQETATVVGTPAGTPPGFYRQADLHFQNMEALSAGFASAEGQKGAADAVELGEPT